MYECNGYSLNDEFLLGVYALYCDVRNGKYNNGKGNNPISSSFSQALRSVFLVTDQYQQIGNNILLFSTRNNNEGDLLSVFKEFSRGCSLIYFGNMDVIINAILKLDSDMGNDL